jgi:multidrug efflux pump subunit AcrA (membrane-fusion protein)
MTPYDHDMTIAETQELTAPGIDNRQSIRTNSDAGRSRTLKRISWGVAGVLGGLILIGAVQHYALHHEAVASLQARQSAVPQVRVEPVRVTTSPRDLSLPGSTSAFDSATIYARQSGYVAVRNVDIGSKVKAGDVLAVIASPEIDDQLNQARSWRRCRRP